jgi:hypothetical protein
MKLLREWRAAKWGSQSWLPPAFSRRLEFGRFQVAGRMGGACFSLPGERSSPPPAFSRRLDTLESVSAGTIACPTGTPALCHVKEHSYESP